MGEPTLKSFDEGVRQAIKLVNTALGRHADKISVTSLAYLKRQLYGEILITAAEHAPEEKIRTSMNTIVFVGTKDKLDEVAREELVSTATSAAMFARDFFDRSQETTPL
jgi:hypothetical protein